MSPRPTPPGAHHATDFVHKLAAHLAGDVRVEGFWLEGEDESIQWPPYEHLDLHFAVPEPAMEAVRTSMAALFEAMDVVTDFSQQEAPLKGWAGSAVLSDGTPLTYRVERTSQVGKVPRRAVNILLDRSNGLMFPGLSLGG